MSILSTICDNQKQIWSDPNKRREIFNSCALAGMTSYAAEHFFRFGNERLKAITIIGFMCTPFMGRETRIASVIMAASLCFYENVLKGENALKGSKIPTFAIHSAVVLGTYLYCSVFPQAQEEKK